LFLKINQTSNDGWKSEVIEYKIQPLAFFSLFLILHHLLVLILGKITDPIVFNPYVVGSLPTSGGTITLEQSETANSLAWKTLKTYVGLYSSGATTPYGFYYSDNGSYITDFFVDNNIEFTESNVITCSPLIKIYATQKYKKIEVENE
jgi:hypothetical protein